MPRLFASKSMEPWKISRTKIELFTKCPRCFYLDQRLGIKRPSGPPMSLNIAVDGLLKKEFDAHRAQQTAHPFMKEYGIDAVPFAHPSMDEWRHNFTGVRTVHTPTNLAVFGAVDDIWSTPEGELIVVDYKATSKAQEVSLDAPWQISYKRQMEVYQWLLRQNGFAVSPTGYFVYVNGRTDLEAFDGKLEFRVKLLPYTGSDAWVEDTLLRIRKCLRSSRIPKAAGDCEYCAYIDHIEQLQKT